MGSSAEGGKTRGRSKGTGPLVVTSFVQSGRTNVSRNELLVLKFSTALRRQSVNERTVRLLQVTSAGDTPVDGALRVRGSTVTIDPTRSRQNLRARRRNRDLEPDRTRGFEAFGEYRVEIPGPPALRTLKNLRRRRIVQGFSSTFRTDDRYLDTVPGPPEFVGISGTGQLGFDPPAAGTTGQVDEDAVLVLEFSEPMELASIDPASSLSVVRTRLGERVPGVVRRDPNEPGGRTFLFVPSFGFGSDLVNGTGWDIEVRIGDGGAMPRDLAGNELRRPVALPPFRTRYVPGKQSASLLVEGFDDQLQMDVATIAGGAEWNTLEEGYLRSGAATQFPDQDFALTTANSNLPGLTRFLTTDPLVSPTLIVAPNGNVACLARPHGGRVQLLYTPADVGAEGAITSMGWGPSSNALFPAKHPRLRMRLGHTAANALTADFTAAFQQGTGQLVYDGPYAIPGAKNINPSDPVDANGVTQDPFATGFWLWPAFTSPFEWNGVSNLVFDVAGPAGTTCQNIRASFVAAGGAFPNRHALNNTNWASDTADVVQPAIYDMRFRKRRRTTRAVSSWRALAAEDAQVGLPIVSPVEQPAGVEVVVELEGADARPDPLDPGNEVPNLSTATGWSTDPADASGRRFVRFRIVMRANLVTGRGARIDSIQIPYIFR